MNKKKISSERSMAKTEQMELKRKSLSEIAYEKIKEAIIVSELAPGQEVTESQLAEDFEMGKAPIRYALASLTKEGLIQPQKRRGYRITPLTIKDIHDVWAIRLLLETEAARLAAGKIDIQYLQNLDRTLKKGFTQGDFSSQRKYLAANRDFHLAICRSSGNNHLTKIVEQLINHMSRMLYLAIVVSNKTEQFEHGHTALVKALASGNGDQAARITEEHLESGRETVLNWVMQSPALMQVNLVPETKLSRMTALD